MLPYDAPSNYRRVVGWKDPILLEIPDGLRFGIGKKRLQLRMVGEVHLGPLQSRSRRVVQDGPGVDLPVEEHGGEVRRCVVEVQPRRRRKRANSSANAMFLGPLLVPDHILRFHPELILELAARPECRRLLVVEHADTLALQVLRPLYSSVGMSPYVGRIGEGPVVEDGEQPVVPVPLREGDEGEGEGHLRKVEPLELSLLIEEVRPRNVSHVVERDPSGLHFAGDQCRYPVVA